MNLTFTKRDRTGTLIRAGYSIEEAMLIRGRHKLDQLDYVSLDVRSPFSASWVFIYRFGRPFPIELGLGTAFINRVATLPLKVERLALRYINMLSEGRNPRDHKGERTAATFGELLEREIAFREQSSLNKDGVITWLQGDTWRRWQDQYFPALQIMRPKHITPEIVAQQLRTKWVESPATADRARDVIEIVIDHQAKLNNLFPRDMPNPADRAIIERKIGQRAFRASTDSEEQVSVHWRHVQALVARIVNPKTSHWRLMGMSRKALLVAVAIPHRSGEILKMKRADVDLTTGVWVTPIEDNKKRHYQINILPSHVLEILRSIPELPGNPYFFAGKGEGDHIEAGAMRSVLQRDMKVTAMVDGEAKPASVHGFRSTMVTWAAEAASQRTDREMMKSILSHRATRGKKGKEALDAYLRAENIEARAAKLQEYNNWLFPAGFVTANDNRPALAVIAEQAALALLAA